jgi:hypothetical protein
MAITKMQQHIYQRHNLKCTMNYRYVCARTEHVPSKSLTKCSVDSQARTAFLDFSASNYATAIGTLAKAQVR